METTPSPFAGSLSDSEGFAPKFAKEGVTFDDVLLVPAESSSIPAEVDTSTKLTPRIALSVPIVSAAMDTVTESALAIAMARLGAIGIIHRNLSIEDQASEVDRVKRSQSGMIADPVTLRADARVTDALELMARYRISGVPITDGAGKLVGLLTNRDLRFVEDVHQPIENVMRKPPLVTAPLGTTLEQAKDILWQHRIEKLPIVERDGTLRGLITVKDIKKQIDFPLATHDERGRLRVGAAVGVGADSCDRAERLVAAGADVLVVDTAHGHSRGVLDVVKAIKGSWDIDVIGGNIATAEAAEALAGAGADAVKVGVGPGCFAAGTRVLMADATYRDIQDVRPGDRVINMHGKPVSVVQARCTGVREVIAVRHGAAPRETIVTPDHRYLVAEPAPLGAGLRGAAGSGAGAVAVAADTAAGAVAVAGGEWREVGAPGAVAYLAPASISFESFEPLGAIPHMAGGAGDAGAAGAAGASADAPAGGFRAVEPLGTRWLGISLPVYDIEVDCPTHSFIADGVVVHNSICTTRVVAGVGVPQLTAVYDAARAANRHGVTVIADGGIQLSGDIAKAIAAGAHCVMLGGLLAGVDESPGEVVLHQGERYKEYRGMGSLGAMKTRSFSRDRYFQGDVGDADKLVPEGIDGRVAYKGPLANVLFQLVGGLRAAMGYCGAPTVEDLRQRGRFVRITGAGLRESHPHGVTITAEAPNYRPL